MVSGRTVGPEPTPGSAGHGQDMTPAAVHPWLYDPAGVGVLVRSRRPTSPGNAVSDVVSDVVWTAVVRLLRWSDAALGGPDAVVDGAAWRAAAGSAELLRRLPGLSDELGEPWVVVDPVEDDDLPPRERLAAAAQRLVGWLSGDAAVPLARVADAAERLGAAAVALVAARTDWSAVTR